ncbi:DUF3617 family protein [Sphingomonas sp. LM7]|uniref:DUF3617 domain-containing protein n=1 Tax=Sphingomonas sp. LM7 TaxID=1938607 RepID=UPI000983DEDB|nr:DUF3617 family protein [Sphingomonas sp. LM7]AQR73952.1 hypothetical protein BXU08_10095 [Sphingomonas sp. LM7]
MRKGWFLTCCLAAPLLIASALASPQAEPGKLVQQMGLKAGRWHTTGRIISGQILPATPGSTVPDELQDQLRKKLGTSFETEDCIGSKRANGDLILPGIKIASDCLPIDAEARGHTLRLKSTCGDGADGFKVKTEVQASYQNTAMTARISVSAFSGGTGTMTKLELATSSKFVGTC